MDKAIKDDLDAVRGSPPLDPQDPMSIARKLVADRFTDADNKRLLHRHDKSFWVYDQSHYREIDDEAFNGEVWKYLEHEQRLDAKGNLRPFKPTKAVVANVVDAAQSVCALSSKLVSPAWINEQGNRSDASEILPVANGLLHLRTGKLLPPTPDFFVTGASEIAFDKNAKCPRWMQFLGETVGDDKEQVTLIQDWFGYCLSDDTSQQKILLIRGELRSGKGTIGRILRGLLGSTRVVSPTLESLQQTFGMQSLIRRPLAIISDARIGGRSDNAALLGNLLTVSGEDAVSVPRKYKGDWGGKLPTRFMIMTNLLLKLPDASGVFATRLLPLDFKNTFYGKEDTELTGTLLAEASGILNWALDGYKRLKKRKKFLMPSTTEHLIEELQVLAAPVKAFVEEHCVLDPTRVGVGNELCAGWKMWCENNGRLPGDKSMFSRNLRSAFPQIEIYRIDNKKMMRGIYLPKQVEKEM